MNNPKSVWAVWIDDNKKVVFINENSNGNITYYENKDIGIKAVAELVSKGYKIV